ncbi:MAG: HAMP domain-containing protein [Chitinivibrionales bacterium]|nr:HAMP domain-containing protein [Chitinivibrionales bacterium]MBD3394115.1 HAMP domain-containing protein [Chitinivibrionales bacterium]
MRRTPFFWYLFPSFLVVAVIACAVIIAYTTHAAKSFHLESTREELKAAAILFAARASSLVDTPARNGLDSLSKSLGRSTGTRFTVILPDGTVLADSHEEPQSMDNHADRPEIMIAMSSDTGMATRFSATLKRQLMYVAIPAVHHDSVVAAIRASVPLVSVTEAFETVSIRFLLAGLVVAMAAVLISIALSRRLCRPLEDLKRGAERFAQGDLSARLPIPQYLETAELASAMNGMAAQLDERISTITKQRNEQDAILSSMIEGVVAVDQHESIIMMNAAAGTMLDTSADDVRGKLIQEGVRNTDLQRFIRATLERREPSEQEIQSWVAGNEERTLRVNGTALKDADGSITGAVIVLHDVSHLKKLENIRRDFVANVSHELRTPLTSIKGFVETLLDGAMDHPEERERFLSIIANHVNRLNTIIEDLMTLSRLEKEAGQEAEMAETGLDAITKDAMEVCDAKARERGIALAIEGSSGIVAWLNASLVEQAVINLIDNAVKYSSPNTTVRVRCERDSREIRISVQDEGPGISPEHLPRLFERFYRIDKARSRKLGGTGLGLSIVKHIMVAHRGSVTVDSAPENGSTFTLHIPVRFSAEAQA